MNELVERRERDRHRKRERDKHRKRERHTEREIETNTERETDTERERERERERDGRMPNVLTNLGSYLFWTEFLSLTYDLPAQPVQTGYHIIEPLHPQLLVWGMWNVV